MLLRFLILSFALLGALGATLLALSPTLADRFLFLPSRGDPGPPPVLSGVEGKSRRLITSDGVAIQAWWYRATVPEAPAVLFLHGNAGEIGDRTPLAAGLLAEGVSVLLLEYRGYGASGGRPSEEGLPRDALAGYGFLRGEVGEGGCVVVFGRSMGGAVAASLAGEARVQGLILESAFTSLEEMARAAYPILPSLLLRRLRGRLATLELVADARAPVLVIHGTRDELVPLAMGHRIFQAAKEPKAWMEVPGAGHNDVAWVGGADYFAAVAGFARGCGGGRPRS